MKNDNLGGDHNLLWGSHHPQSQKTLRRYFWYHFGEGVEGVWNSRDNDFGRDKMNKKYSRVGGLILDGKWALGAPYPNPAVKTAWLAMGLLPKYIWWGCWEGPTSPSCCIYIAISPWDPFLLIQSGYYWDNPPPQKWNYPWSPLLFFCFSPPPYIIQCQT